MRFDAIYFRIISILSSIGLIIWTFATTREYRESVIWQEIVFLLIFATVIFQCTSSILSAIIKVYDKIQNKE